MFPQKEAPGKFYRIRTFKYLRDQLNCMFHTFTNLVNKIKAQLKTDWLLIGRSGRRGARDARPLTVQIFSVNWRDAYPFLGQKFLYFHAVFGKRWSNSMLASPLWEILDPPLVGVLFRLFSNGYTLVGALSSDWFLSYGKFWIRSLIQTNSKQLDLLTLTACRFDEWMSC